MLLAVLPPSVAIEIRRWRHKRFALVLLLLAPFSAARTAISIDRQPLLGSRLNHIYLKKNLVDPSTSQQRIQLAIKIPFFAGGPTSINIGDVVVVVVPGSLAPPPPPAAARMHLISNRRRRRRRRRRRQHQQQLVELRRQELVTTGLLLPPYY